MDSTIREAAVSDLPAISRHLVATWHDTYDDIYGKHRVDEFTKRWHSIKALELGLKLPQSYFPITIYRNEIVATAFARLDAVHVIGLRRLYVEPSIQRRGLGGALLQAVVDKFPAATKMTLEVEPANSKACAFYERNGFRVTGQADGSGDVEDSIPCQIMERQLLNS